MRFLSLGGILSLAAIAMVPLPLAAAPLDKEACDRLQAEKHSLVVLGVEKEMAKGAEWAKANMQPAQLDLVKRYIAVEEQLKFRCRPALLKAEAKNVQAGAVPVKASPKTAKQAKGTPATTAKTAAKNAKPKAEPAPEAEEDKTEE